MQITTILLVGVGGYGTSYVNALYEQGSQHGSQVVGIVDPYAKQSREYEKVLSMNAPIYDTVEAFYADHTADLAIISTPISLHASQSIYCMEHGSHVLVEKPIAATVQDAQRMINARDRAGKLLAVGFQWCYDPVMRAFHEDVRAGALGRLVSLKSIVLWPRNIAYYHRGTGWAGKKYDAKGNPIFDSVASNATAHYLENLLWNAGGNLTDIDVDIARANPIETFDTIVLKGSIGGARLTYAASHAINTDEVLDPVMEYTFEKGSTCFRGIRGGSELTVHWNDGTEKQYGVTYNENSYLYKLWDMIDAIHGKGSIACTAEDALLHTRVMEKIREIMPEARVFPPERVRLENDMYWVPGLAKELKEAVGIQCLE